MLYIYTLSVASFLVVAQALWKISTKALDSNAPFSLASMFNKVLFTPQFIIGGILYVAATLIYVWLFSKFPYYQVQLTLITFSLILSTLVSSLFFKEYLLPINYLGIFILLLGVLLVTFKK